MIFFSSLAVRWAINDVVEPDLPVQFFLLDALLVSALYGYLPALVCLIAGWFLGLYFFVAPYGEASSISKFDVLLTLNYFMTGLFGIAVFEYLQRVRCSTRLMLAVSESRYRSLLRLDNHRIHQQRQSTRALRQVGDIFLHLDRVLLLINQDSKFFSLPLLAEITGQLHENRMDDWLTIVHSDDRQRIETEIGTVMAGQRESREVKFRLCNKNAKDAELECIFRTLTLSAHKQVFALLLKAPQRV
jgi:K+-sensing histidine kinase KdpD